MNKKILIRKLLELSDDEGSSFSLVKVNSKLIGLILKHVIGIGTSALAQLSYAGGVATEARHIGTHIMEQEGVTEESYEWCSL